MAKRKPIGGVKPVGRDRATIDARSARYNPRMVVKFRDSIELAYHDQLADSLDEQGIVPWKQLLQHFPGLTMRRLFTSLDPKGIQELVERATRRDGSYVPPNFLTYFLVEHPAEINRKELASALMASPSVQTAYFDSPGSDPQVNPSDDPRAANQGYLDPAPDGIDAEYAWQFGGGDGVGQEVIDLEQGWTLDHEDLIAHRAQLLHGTILDSSRPHGTKVLGVMCASDNQVGCVGIAPNVNSLNVVSYNGSNRPDAILAAIANLRFGSVLLLNAQLDDPGLEGLPIEALEAEFQTIRLATALGIIVVEAAGNGGTDFDKFVDQNGNPVLVRAYRDSGAILVGAATFTSPHGPLLRSGHPICNFGSRIDCYAWGEMIDTTSSTTVFPFGTSQYTGNFGMTSGAAPIIAGAALVVQGLAQANLNPSYRFTPVQMRALLTNPATGTLSNDPPNDKIGIMPDLRAIIQSAEIALAADVYVRDFVGDTGDPHTDAISASPDIILRPTSEADPQIAFGEGSGTENDNTLGTQAEAGQDNFVYVRVRNRGGSDASNVMARVYWSPPATLVTPDLWTLIGQTAIPTVPSGNVLTVSDAIVWANAAIPQTGHYCLVGLVGTADDPPPAPADFLNWNNYEMFVRNNNNVTWRNFNVVDNQPGPNVGAEFVDMDFFAAGPPDEAREMKLEIMARLPKGSRVFLQMPIAMYDSMLDRMAAEFDERRTTVRIALNPYGLRSLGAMLFTAKSLTKLRLQVHIPHERRKMPYEVFVRHMYQNREVGRITWRLSPLAREADRVRALAR